MLTEANRLMSKETIIFFDKLGFGWVLDKITAKEMNERRFARAVVADKNNGAAELDIAADIL